MVRMIKKVLVVQCLMFMEYNVQYLTPHRCPSRGVIIANIFIIIVGIIVCVGAAISDPMEYAYFSQSDGVCRDSTTNTLYGPGE